jgi:hypothetical protein
MMTDHAAGGGAELVVSCHVAGHAAKALLMHPFASAPQVEASAIAATHAAVKNHFMSVLRVRYPPDQFDPGAVVPTFRARRPMGLGTVQAEPSHLRASSHAGPPDSATISTRYPNGGGHE